VQESFIGVNEYFIVKGNQGNYLLWPWTKHLLCRLCRYPGSTRVRVLVSVIPSPLFASPLTYILYIYIILSLPPTIRY